MRQETDSRRQSQFSTCRSGQIRSVRRTRPACSQPRAAVRQHVVQTAGAGVPWAANRVVLSTNREPTNRDMDHAHSIHRWLERPLCRQYIAVVFSSCFARLEAGSDRSTLAHWALGRLINGEVEIVGAWTSHNEVTHAATSMFRELLARGAESIRFGVGDLGGCETEFQQIYKRGQLVPSVEQSLEKVSGLIRPRHRVEVLKCLREASESEKRAGQPALPDAQDHQFGKRYPEVVRRWGEALAAFEPIYDLDSQLRAHVRSADRTAAEVRGCLSRAILRHGPFIDSAAALDFVARSLMRAERRLDRERAAAKAVRRPGPATARRAASMPGTRRVPALA